MNMRNKAIENMNTAQHLINSQDPYKCTSSVHCSYYAVLQYMKYILANIKKNPVSYETQNSHSGESSHTYILNEVKNRIPNPRNEKRVSENVKILRDSRVQSDYCDKIFTVEESIDCHNKATKIISDLNRCFSSKI